MPRKNPQRHRESIPGPSDLQRSALTTTLPQAPSKLQGQSEPVWTWREEFLPITISKWPIWLIWTTTLSYDVTTYWSLPQTCLDTDSDMMTAFIKLILIRNKNFVFSTKSTVCRNATTKAKPLLLPQGLYSNEPDISSWGDEDVTFLGDPVR